MSTFGLAGRFLPLDLSVNSSWEADNPNGDLSVPAEDAALSSWADIGLNGNTMTQANGSLQPIFKRNVMNSHHVVRFGGSQFFSRAHGSENAYAGSMTIIAIASTTTTSGVSRFITKQNSYSFGRNATSTQYTAVSIQGYSSSSSQWSNNVFQVATVMFNSSSGATFYKNGVFINTVSGSGINSSTDSIRLGTWQGSTEFWNGDINGLYLFFRMLHNWELPYMHLYCRTKAGI